MAGGMASVAPGLAQVLSAAVGRAVGSSGSLAIKLKTGVSFMCLGIFFFLEILSITVTIIFLVLSTC